MNFFKHFTDSHNDKAVIELMNEFGHAGYACWFILCELLMEKMERKHDGELQESDFNFVVHERFLRQNLRLSSTKLELFLNKSSELSQLSFKKVAKEFNLHVPKLLEYMDRDSKRARSVRAPCAPKNKIKKKIKNNIIEEDKELKTSALVLAIPNELTNKLKPTGRDLLSQVKNQASIEHWLSTYEPNFIAEQINLASQWLIDNEETRKSIAGFLSGWMNRAKAENKFKKQPAKVIDYSNDDFDSGYDI